MFYIAAFSAPGWPNSLLSAGVALAITLALFGLCLRLALRLSSRLPVAASLLTHTRVPARLLLAMISLQFVWDETPASLPLVGAVRHITALALIVALTWLGLRLIRCGAHVVAVLRPVKVGDNLQARRLQTQVLVLSRILMGFMLLLGIASALMTFPNVRQLGTSLLASAGVAGLIAGLAARPVLSNVIAGMQIAFTQPIRLDDVLIVEGEWGRVEELTGAFVVVKLWDERRLIVPLQWFIEHPFQNWTRASSDILGSAFLWFDYGVPVQALRAELLKICQGAPEWDGRLAQLQITDANERAVQLRALVSAADSTRSWDLRCRVREGLIDFVNRDYPQCLPQLRARVDSAAQQP